MRWPGRPLKAQVMLDFSLDAAHLKRCKLYSVLTDASLEAILVNGQMKREGQAK